MDSFAIRRLYEEKEKCTICQGGFYANDIVAFSPNCSVHHYIHPKCLMNFSYETNTETSYKCSICKQQANSVSKIIMPCDLPTRLQDGESPPEYQYPLPPPPPPSPRPPPSMFGPGTSLLDAGEILPRRKPEFLDEGIPEILAPDGSLPKDPSVVYCFYCGCHLKPNEWVRINDIVFCVECPLHITFSNVFPKKRPRDLAEDGETAIGGRRPHGGL